MREVTGARLMVDDLKTCKKWTYYWSPGVDWYDVKMKPVLRFEDGLILPDEKYVLKTCA